MTNHDNDAPIAWLTSGGVARALSVDPNTVRLWARSGKLPYERASGGQRLFSRVDVARLAAARLAALAARR